MKGGMGIILGPTGGFIVAFPIVAYLISYFKEYMLSLSFFILLNTLFGIVVTYFIGVLWLDYYIEQTFFTLFKGMLIFIPFDIVKAVIASLIGVSMRKINI